jgi:lipid-binding SYLF domain-containing protein
MDMLDAEASLLINDMTITTADPRFAIIDKVIPRAAGVRIWPELVSAGHMFGFQNQSIYFGFNVGILARRPESNHPAIP